MNARQSIDLVMFTYGDWVDWSAYGPVRRNAALFQQFRADPAVERILVVNVARSLAYRALNGYRSPLGYPDRVCESGPRYQLFDIDEKCRLLNFSVPFPGEYGRLPLYRLNRLLLPAAAVARRIRSTTRAMKMRPYLLWIDNPLYSDMIGRLEARVSVFDCIDDWRFNPRLKQFRRLLDRGYRTATADADVFVTVSRSLRDRIGAASRNAYWLPNGVHTESFAGSPRPAKDQLPSTNMPRVGYVGAMRDGRIDVKLFGRVAQLLPDVSFIFVGDSPPRDLERYANCYFIDRCAYDRVPAYLASFDAVMMPHNVDAYNATTYPLKLLQYLASGKPIVSTPVSGTDDYPDLLRIAREPDEFARQIRMALQEPPESALREKRRAAAMLASWTNRYQEIMSVVQEQAAE